MSESGATRGSNASSRDDGSPRGCIVYLIFWMACLFTPAIGLAVAIALFPPELQFVPPMIGVLLALASMVIYARYGMRLLPGLVPGLLGLWMFAGQIGTMCLALYRLNVFLRERAGV
jgi:hypothetical protein